MEILLQSSFWIQLITEGRIMKHLKCVVLFLCLMMIWFGPGYADSIMFDVNSDNQIKFPSQKMYTSSSETASPTKAAIWPFGKSDEGEKSIEKPKSARKAFFLSLILPGLGEAYVGSKRSFFFVGLEAAAWWMYMTNTKKGNDLEDDFRAFANTHWHYDDNTPENVEYNYWNWLKYHFNESFVEQALEQKFGDDVVDNLQSTNYALIDSLLHETVKNSNSSIYDHAIETLPTTKTQQYYEMIGKYPQFIYGWEDIDDLDVNGNPLNPTLRDSLGVTNKYNEAIQNINSPMRIKYKDMRYDSNQKLKAGQRGIYIMLINRVLSAVDAGRLAYHHNKKMKSDLSMVRIHFVQKHIIDNEVPMIMITKKF